jgi:lactoylglutathione lyase
VRNFGHLAYPVDDIYGGWRRRLQSSRYATATARVRSPDGISIELLQKGDAPPPKEPWGIHG